MDIMAEVADIESGRTAAGSLPELPGAADDVTVGRVRVVSLLDAPTPMAADDFLGAERAALLAEAPDGLAPSAFSAFLLQFPDSVIMIDAGGSIVPERPSWILSSLEQAGFSPEQVSSVFLTHLHTDHVGGLALNGRCAFPNAMIRICGQEWDFWFSDAAMAGHPERKAAFECARRTLALYQDRVIRFSFGDTLRPEITAVDASGHTPGHTGFLLESGGERLLFWGDLLHAALWQLPSPEIYTVWDLDVAKAIASRQRLLRRAALEKLPVAGSHLPFPGRGRIAAMDNGGFIFRPGLR
jgi:glyoxylase-like metal-dependent hydrolase (beta-lactamase superfamily II)